jgi:hypothetical protein
LRRGPDGTEEFVLLEDGGGRFFHIVGRVAALAENSSDHDAEAGPNGLPDRPVDVDVLPDARHQPHGDDRKRQVADDSDGGVAGFQRFVEGTLIGGRMDASMGL